MLNVETENESYYTSQKMLKMKTELRYIKSENRLTSPEVRFDMRSTTYVNSWRETKREKMATK